MKFFMKTANDL